MVLTIHVNALACATANPGFDNHAEVSRLFLFKIGKKALNLLALLPRKRRFIGLKLRARTPKDIRDLRQQIHAQPGGRLCFASTAFHHHLITLATQESRDMVTCRAMTGGDPVPGAFRLLGHGIPVGSDKHVNRLAEVSHAVAPFHDADMHCLIDY